jgi:hypothetical protein
MKKGVMILGICFSLLIITSFISAVGNIIDPFKNINGYYLDGFYPLSENQLVAIGVSNSEVVPNGTGYGHIYSLLNLDSSVSNFRFDSNTFSPSGWSKDYAILRYSDSYLLSHWNNYESLGNKYFSYNLNTGELKYINTTVENFVDNSNYPISTRQVTIDREIRAINPDDDFYYYISKDSYFDNNGSESWIYVNSYNLNTGENKSLFRLVWPSSVELNKDLNFQVNIDSIDVSNGILILIYDTLESTATSISPQTYSMNKYLAYYNLSSNSGLPIDIKNFVVFSVKDNISLNDGEYNYPDSGIQTDGKIILWPEYNYKNLKDTDSLPRFSGFYYYNLSDKTINKLDILDSSQPLPNLNGQAWDFSNGKLVWVDNRNLNLPLISNVAEAIYGGITDNPTIYYYDISSGTYKRVSYAKGGNFNPQIKGDTIFWQSIGKWWTNPSNFGNTPSTISYIKISDL